MTGGSPVSPDEDRASPDREGPAERRSAPREFTSSGSDGDLGAADPDLSAALDDPRNEKAFMRAVSQARLLIPLVAMPRQGSKSGQESGRESGREWSDESGENLAKKVGRAPDDNPVRPTGAEMAVVVLTSQDGRRAFPVFSSLAALSAWDATARPSPMTSSRAAQGAVGERCDVMLLDHGSGRERVLRPSMVWALAQQREWLPAHEDPFVATALLRATAGEEDVVGCAGEEAPAEPGILRVVLSLRPGLDAGQVQAVATRIGERIATDGEARARIDGLSFTIRRA